jgi:flavin-binding protein dodecin
MAESVYKVIELVGTSPTSWEKAAAAAVKTAAKSLRDLRVAEVTTLDMHLENGQILAYRARVKVSFKYGEPPSAPAAPVRPPARKAAPAPEPAPEPAPAASKKAPRKKKARRKKA